MINLIVFFLLFSICLNNVFGSVFKISNNSDHRLVILKPTGNYINNLPEMTVLSDNSEQHKKIINLFNNSFIAQSVEWYFLAQNYLLKTGQLSDREPAYLALSKNEGGFAKIGFVLNTGNEIIEKAETPYIDLVEGRLDDSPNRLMSITQLYPHEMGHLIYGMLNRNKSVYDSKTSDMHYFSVITDYTTAFNEGFAEHVENVARLNETNDEIKSAIFDDVERIKIKSKNAIGGFLNDYNLPFRLRLYKVSMPFWYQKYENLKRYDHAVNGNINFLNDAPSIISIHDRMTIRNSGVVQTKDIRNYVQMLATEGAVSSFFTALTESELKNYYQDTEFYIPFLADTTGFDPFEGTVRRSWFSKKAGLSIKL